MEFNKIGAMGWFCLSANLVYASGHLVVCLASCTIHLMLNFFMCFFGIFWGFLNCSGGKPVGFCIGELWKLLFNKNTGLFEEKRYK